MYFMSRYQHNIVKVKEGDYVEFDYIGLRPGYRAKGYVVGVAHSIIELKLEVMVEDLGGVWDIGSYRHFLKYEIKNLKIITPSEGTSSSSQTEI